MNKYWFYNTQTLDMITIVSESIEDATMEAKKRVGHNDVLLFGAISL